MGTAGSKPLNRYELGLPNPNGLFIIGAFYINTVSPGADLKSKMITQKTSRRYNGK
jgi:hypothetical protein